MACREAMAKPSIAISIETDENRITAVGTTSAQAYKRCQRC